MSAGTVLVTGGAGYIGSHVVAQLGARGERIVVLDNLSTGSREALLYGELVVGDIGDARLLARLFAEHRFETVLHFAARIVVPESVAHPLEYYDCNTARARVLLEACRLGAVRHLVFSSTAAVYGDPPGGVADESTLAAPITPYGRSKLFTEWMLRDLAAVSPIRYAILRYFNVAGGDPQGRIGQDSPNATHLIKVACQHAVGQRDCVEVFGTDYDTPDGSCVRDYIHVDDLARAHLDALDYLRAGGASLIANCGYGHGFSVEQVMAVLERLHGAPLKVRRVGRRDGDMPMIVSGSRMAREVLGWKPRFDDLEQIIGSALAWEQHRMQWPLRPKRTAIPAMPASGVPRRERTGRVPQRVPAAGQPGGRP